MFVIISIHMEMNGSEFLMRDINIFPYSRHFYVEVAYSQGHGL